MFRNPFLEEVTVNKDKRQQLDHLLRVTAPHERVILGGIGLVVLALAAWALFGSVVRAVTVDGVLIEPGARHDIISTEPGYLAEYLVAPGDRVEAGAPIARQSVPELDRETAALRDRVELLEQGTRQAGGDGGPLRTLLASARVALLQMEAQRSAREYVVSQIAGRITALRASPGDYLPAGAAVAQLRDAGDQPLQAVLRIASRMAQRIRPGMEASVDVVMPDGTTRRWDGRVASVTPGPLPRWLALLPPAAPDSSHRVDVVLTRTSELPLPDGTPCRVRIVIGRHSPAALFDLERS